MFHKFNCQRDPLLAQLHKTYNATPFLPPMNSIKPLHLVAHRGNRTMHLGPLEEVLVPNGAAFGLEEQNAEVSNVNLNKTSTFSGELGFKLLEGILSGFNLSIEPFKAVLTQEVEVTLDFQGTRRRAIHHTSLGTALRHRAIDLDHPSIKGLFKEKDGWLRFSNPMGMFVIGSVLESRQFSIHLNRKGSVGLELEAPVLGKLTDVGFKVQHDGAKTLGFSHEGDNYLVFAFACFELEMDGQGGLSIQQEVAWRRGGLGDPAADDTPAEPMAGGEDNPEISLIDWQLPSILAWD